MKKAFVIALIAVVAIGSLSAGIFDDIGKGIEKAGKAVGETVEKAVKPDIEKTTVTIGSGVKGPIDVIFKAAGCAGTLSYITDVSGMYDMHYICEHKTLQPGQSTTYEWKWGQTNKRVQIGVIKLNTRETHDKLPYKKGKLIPYYKDKTYSGDQLKKPILYDEKIKEIKIK